MRGEDGGHYQTFVHQRSSLLLRMRDTILHNGHVLRPAKRPVVRYTSGHGSQYNPCLRESIDRQLRKHPRAVERAQNLPDLLALWPGEHATGPAAPFAMPVFYASQIAAISGAALKAKNLLGGGGSVSSPSGSGGGGVGWG